MAEKKKKMPEKPKDYIKVVNTETKVEFEVPKKYYEDFWANQKHLKVVK